jgi:hypothetical protein
LLLKCILIIIIIAIILYWFRHTCQLILAKNSSTNYALKVADTIRLSFPTVQQALRTEVQRPELDRLHQSLDHDCQVLTKLLNQAGGSHTFERRLLALDYQVMNVWYQLTRTNDLARARNALAEMASILSYIAGDIGQQGCS